MNVRSAIATIAVASAFAAGAEVSAERVLRAGPGAEIGRAVFAPSQMESADRALSAPDLRVLLSSIDVTVGLIDAYGQCRDEDLEHEPCMAMIRSTLGHARDLIGQEKRATPR